ncbi:DUF3048 domain-containing protein [Salipaludibacillus sp. HK11]|uniref:DUF3048 domain-containing protein n=1 Tax=Salipaludibacillus sp. HK11 TaxID=3394320 RepID=UPI0039FD993A
MGRSKITLFIFIVFLLFIFAACSGDNEVVEEEVDEESDQVEEENNEPEVEPEPDPEPEFAGVYPLTGDETDNVVDHRAFGIMIENSSSARPQSGLYQADVVYEVLSEGRITRLLAFYHSQQPERIGPVRSARDYYIFLNNGYDAMYASAGGSPGAFDLVDRGQVPYINALTYDGQFFSRSSERSAPHNMYTTYEDLQEAAEHIAFDLEGRKPPELPFTEEADASLSERESLAVHVDYGSSINNVTFEYDEDLDGYIRSVGGERVDDMETGNPVAPRNLFIVGATHRVVDDQGRRDIDIESGGNAYLIQDGYVIEAEWQNVDGVILPFKEGEPLHFLPGQTWINFVESIDSDVSFQEEEED